MGIAYCCDAATASGIEVWDGDITFEQARLHMDALAADPQWAASRRVVTDLTRLPEESRPSAETLALLGDTFLQHLAHLVGDAKWAVIADRAFFDAIGFGALIEAEVRHLIVFNNLATACTWLGLDPIDVRCSIDDLCQQLRGESS